MTTDRKLALTLRLRMPMPSVGYRIDRRAVNRERREAADEIERLTAENSELRARVARLETELDEAHTAAAIEFADAIKGSHL